jgi:hypothetical protein
MNYLKQYKLLIRNAQQRDAGSEMHHVFPRSIFGDNNNIVALTMREHYIAHKLLFHICENRYGSHPYTYKMANAVIMMGNRCSRHYELARRHFIENHHTKTEEGRRHISERQKGSANGMYGKSAPNRGVPHSPESNEKNRQAHNKSYELYFTDGTTRLITGAKAFAKQNGYNLSHLIQVVKGNRKRHKDIIGGKKLD